MKTQMKRSKTPQPTKPPAFEKRTKTKKPPKTPQPPVLPPRFSNLEPGAAFEKHRAEVTDYLITAEKYNRETLLDFKREIKHLIRGMIDDNEKLLQAEARATVLQVVNARAEEIRRDFNAEVNRNREASDGIVFRLAHSVLMMIGDEVRRQRQIDPQPFLDQIDAAVTKAEAKLP